MVEHGVMGGGDMHENVLEIFYIGSKRTDVITLLSTTHY